MATPPTSATRPTLATLAILPILVALAILPLCGSVTFAADTDPWRLLEQARDSLSAAGGLTADFTQSYVPAGFSSGEEESGHLFLALPDCLRWDYETPYPKSYLICGETVHAWNPGEPSGRRTRVDAQQEPGLDLLMLSVDRLRSRYTATVVQTGEREIEIQLDPTGDADVFATATLWLEAAGMRPARIAYQDLEGNRTTFLLSSYRSLDPSLAVFDPPANLEWID